jgi:3-oxoacyl-[acyl-carrier-protein] synthase-1
MDGIAIKSTGLVSSVGQSAPASCAAIRAKISNPSETRFAAPDGSWIMAHQVQFEQPWRGIRKLIKMAARAISECLESVLPAQWEHMPLLVCVAEGGRPGRLDGLEEQILRGIEKELGARFSSASGVVACGRVGAAVALARARDLIMRQRVSRVLVVAVDSLLVWPSLSVYLKEGRLLTENNSDGFMPGEAGAALLLGACDGGEELSCVGIGMAQEAAHIASGEPLRGKGLTNAIEAALVEAGREIYDLDYRIVDLSGEQYYFKEATLALSRILRRRKESFDIWHPAESIGESGAAIGVVALVVAHAACKKSYGDGPNILLHFANDSGERAALVLRYGDGHG